jgi:hypothetical protein
MLHVNEVQTATTPWRTHMRVVGDLCASASKRRLHSQLPRADPPLHRVFTGNAGSRFVTAQKQSLLAAKPKGCSTAARLDPLLRVRVLHHDQDVLLVCEQHSFKASRVRTTPGWLLPGTLHMIPPESQCVHPATANRTVGDRSARRHRLWLFPQLQLKRQRPAPRPRAPRTPTAPRPLSICVVGAHARAETEAPSFVGAHQGPP